MKRFDGTLWKWILTNIMPRLLPRTTYANEGYVPTIYVDEETGEKFVLWEPVPTPSGDYLPLSGGTMDAASYISIPDATGDATNNLSNSGLYASAPSAQATGKTNSVQVNVGGYSSGVAATQNSGAIEQTGKLEGYQLYMSKKENGNKHSYAQMVSNMLAIHRYDGEGIYFHAQPDMLHFGGRSGDDVTNDEADRSNMSRSALVFQHDENNKLTASSQLDADGLTVIGHIVGGPERLTIRYNTITATQYVAPSNDGDFVQKKYVDDLIAQLKADNNLT